MTTKLTPAQRRVLENLRDGWRYDAEFLAHGLTGADAIHAWHAMLVERFIEHVFLNDRITEAGRAALKEQSK